MPFELIMLLGFFGAALAGLLPAAPARVADDSFRGERRRRSDAEPRPALPTGRVRRRDEALRRVEGRAAG